MILFLLYSFSLIYHQNKKQYRFHRISLSSFSLLHSTESSILIFIADSILIEEFWFEIGPRRNRSEFVFGIRSPPTEAAALASGEEDFGEANATLIYVDDFGSGLGRIEKVNRRICLLVREKVMVIEILGDLG